MNDSDCFSYVDTVTYQINEASEPVLLVKQLQDGSERKGDGEEHCGVAAARCV